MTSQLPRSSGPDDGPTPSVPEPPSPPEFPDFPPLRLSRRKFLAGLGLTAGAWGAWRLWDYQENFQSASVAVVKAHDYDARLEPIIRDGLDAIGFDARCVKGKSILLKPNLVEPRAETPHVNTHPAVVRALAEVFRRWDAREVFVAEGQGHCRDWRLVLEASGLGPVLEEAQIEYVDLNHDDVFATPNRLRFTDLAEFYLPKSLRRADLVVSVAKMKTHHWAGATLSMKNLFGVLPSIAYGWPKNVLHAAGIPRSILDITATVRPHLALIDGIVGMEGDGPIMGTPKRANLLVLGANLPAVDATAVRLMGLDPWRIPYLRSASGRLGPIRQRHIHQRAEPLDQLAQRFELLDHPLMKQFQG
ncbi:MAG: DUF362 domain-containing protein [Planctomycetes bacterium]|nr:DUF362 domain-containing protein [Planctomycetota bacterium]